MKTKPGYYLHTADFFEINTDCNIYCYNLDNQIIAANRHLLDMYKALMGYQSDDDILMKNPLIALPHKGLEVIITENMKVIKTGKAHQFLNRVNFNNKKVFIFVTVKAPMYDNNNKIAGVFGISHLLSIYDINGQIPEKITPRERICLMQLIRGKTSKQIADSLKLSIRTIEFYINNIKNKLACKSKSELIMKIYELGLSTMSEITTSEPFKHGVFIPEEFD